MKSAAEMYNLHWYLLKYDHLCYNLLILVKGFAWYRKIYNVMDYYFIIWGKGKKLQTFAGVFYCISNFFPLLETQHCWMVFTHKIWYHISLVGFVSSRFSSMCNFMLYLRHFFETPMLVIIQKQRNMLRNCVGEKSILANYY